MRVACVCAPDMTAGGELATMSLPQLENGAHGAGAVDALFFDGALLTLPRDDTTGERLARGAAGRNILPMMSDRCARRRTLAIREPHPCGTGEVVPKDLVACAEAGCFPQRCAALAPTATDQVVTL